MNKLKEIRNRIGPLPEVKMASLSMNERVMSFSFTKTWENGLIITLKYGIIEENTYGSFMGTIIYKLN
jgi:hypothetical protein